MQVYGTLEGLVPLSAPKFDRRLRDYPLQLALFISLRPCANSGCTVLYHDEPRCRSCRLVWFGLRRCRGGETAWAQLDRGSSSLKLNILTDAIRGNFGCRRSCLNFFRSQLFRRLRVRETVKVSTPPLLAPPRDATLAGKWLPSTSPLCSHSLMRHWLLPPSSTTRSIHRVSWQFAKQLVCAIDPSCLLSTLPSFLPYPLSSVLPSWAHPLLVDRPHASSWCLIFLSVSHPYLPASISQSTPAAPAPSGDRESAVASEHPSISLFPRLALITNAKHPLAVRGRDRA